MAATPKIPIIIGKAGSPRNIGYETTAFNPPPDGMQVHGMLDTEYELQADVLAGRVATHRPTLRQAEFRHVYWRQWNCFINYKFISTEVDEVGFWNLTQLKFYG